MGEVGNRSENGRKGKTRVKWEKWETEVKMGEEGNRRV